MNMPNAIPIALSKECRDELAQRFETCENMMVTISRMTGLTLLRQIDHLEQLSLQWRAKFKDRGKEVHIKRNLFQKNKKHMEYLEKKIVQLEKEIDWLAGQLSRLGNRLFVKDWEVRFTCPDSVPYEAIIECISEYGGCQNCWREAARKAVEQEHE